MMKRKGKNDWIKITVKPEDGPLSVHPLMAYDKEAYEKKKPKIRKLEKSIEQAHRQGNPHVEAQLLLTLGKLYSDLMMFSLGIQHLEKSNALFRETHDKENEALTFRLMGGIFVPMMLLRDAMESHEKARLLYHQLSQFSEEAREYVSMGQMHLPMSKEKSEACYAEALRLARKHPDRAVEADALLGLGMVSMLKGREKQSLEHMQRALSINQEIGDQDSVANVLSNMITHYKMFGHGKSAIDLCEMAIEIYQEANEPDHVARILSELGDIYFLHHDVDRALAHTQEAMNIVEEIGDFPGAERIRERFKVLQRRSRSLF
jgi:tetratricopeptide (TPR) repeat protein